MKKLLVAFVMVLSAGSIMAQTKIGHVNTQVLLDTMPSRQAAMQQLEDFKVSGVKELQEMEEDLKKAYNKLEVDRPTMTPIMIQYEEDKLYRKEQALAEREQSLNTQMQMFSQQLNEPILKRVQEAIKIVSERHKLNYVIDESITLYFDPALDITKEVIVELLKLDAAALNKP